MAGYILRGQWDPAFARNFFGQHYIRYLADLPSVGTDKSISEGLFLPRELVNSVSGDDYVEIEVPLGTKIMRLVPFIIKVGDPKNLPREPHLTHEDMDVEMISVRAIPASAHVS